MRMTYIYSGIDIVRPFITRKVLFTFLFSLSLIPNHIYSESLIMHYIVAFDTAVPGYVGTKSAPRMKSYLGDILIQNGYDDNDYISIVNYSLNITHPDFGKFAMVPIDSKGIPVKWRHINLKESPFDDLGNWTNIVHEQHNNNLGNGWLASFQSLAKQFILKAVCVNKNEHKWADKTLLLLITDERNNGADDNYRAEWKNVSSIGNYNEFATQRENIFDYANLCNKTSQFSNVKLKNQYGQTFPDVTLTPDGVYKVVAYEVIPNVIPSIQTVTDIPSPLPIRRTKGGYSLRLQPTTVNGNIYSIEKMSLTLPARNGICEILTSKVDTMSAFIKKANLEEGEETEFRIWLRFNDGIYNGCLLSPLDDTYARPLMMKQKLSLQQDDKIFGLVAMPDYLWWVFKTDIKSAVLVWDFILAILFIFILGYVLYRVGRHITKYVPNNGDIKIKTYK